MNNLSKLQLAQARHASVLEMIEHKRATDTRYGGDYGTFGADLVLLQARADALKAEIDYEMLVDRRQGRMAGMVRPGRGDQSFTTDDLRDWHQPFGPALRATQG